MGLSAEAVQAMIREWVPMAEDIDLRVEHIDDACARVRIPFQARNLRPGGSVSGPVMMAAADTAMYAAILGQMGQVAMAVTSNAYRRRRRAPDAGWGSKVGTAALSATFE